MITAPSDSEPIVYQGQFGDFTITESDRQEVKLYRAGLCISALSFAIGSFWLLLQGPTPLVLKSLTICFGIFSMGLAISLIAIHIYLVSLHRLLQVFFLTGTLSTIVLAWQVREPLALVVYNHPVTLLGVGFTFVALTGIYFKEAFCFNRLETKFLVPLVPTLLLGHLAGVLPLEMEKALLIGWSLLFLIFALRKVLQPIPPDIGDKSVFVYLEQQRQSKP